VRARGISALQRRADSDFPKLIPVALAFAASVFLILRQGGSDPNAWYEAALFMVGLLAVAALAPRGPILIARNLALPLVAFALYTAWCYASILWSDDKGIAWDGANRTLLYLAVFGLFALTPVPRLGSQFLFAAFGIAVAGIGVYVFFTTTTSSDPLQSFIGGRFADPIGYPNGNAALFMLGFWSVLPLVASTRVATPVRLLGVGAAALNLDLFLLPESRGGIFAAAVSTLIYICFARDRVRAVGALCVVGACSGLAAPSLFRVFRVAANGGDLVQTLKVARHAILFSGGGAVVSLAVLMGIARLARGRPVATLAARFAAPALLAVASIILVTSAGLALDHRAQLTHRLDAKWEQFTSTPTSILQIQPTSTHFSSDLGGGARYDMWRVAWGEFRAHPVLGVGVDNFAVDYLRERKSDEEPSYPHSALLRLVSQTGIIGAILFGSFVAIVGWRLLRASRRTFAPILPIAVAGFTYWLAHGSVDWLWEIPAVTIPALLMVGSALAMSPDASEDPPRRLPLGRLLVGAACLAGGAALALPWLAIRQETVALHVWRTQPSAAYDALALARNLNRLSDQPDLVAGAIAARRHDYPRTRRSFLGALRRNPSNWYAHLELGALAAIEGSKRRAEAQLAAVRRLNPREPTTAVVQAGLDKGRPVSLASLDLIFIRRVQARNWPGITVRRP
jgi:O-antigen ligase